MLGGRRGRLAAAPGEPWTCPACRESVSSPYCPTCGERRLRPRDLTLRGLADQALQSFVKVDGRLLVTVRTLVSRPGALTVAYVDGRRKGLVGPLQLFLLLNVLFFATQSLTGVKVLSTDLETHLHAQPWSDLATRLVSARVAALHTTREAYAAAFDDAVVVNAKALVGLMVLPFALLPAAAFRARGRPFLTHVTFSLHFHAFLLLCFCAACSVVALSAALGGPGLQSEGFDKAVSLVELAACAAYLTVATRVVYDVHGVRLAAGVAVLVIASVAIVLGYRFLIFLLTLYGT